EAAMAPGAPGAHRCGADPSFAGTPPPELGRPGLRSLLPPAHPRHGDRRALYEWPLTVDLNVRGTRVRARPGRWLVALELRQRDLADQALELPVRRVDRREIVVGRAAQDE